MTEGTLCRAVSGWKKEQVDFAMHFGDIVDGFNPREESPQALDTLVREFDRLGKPHWHMIGNHCLYNFPRDVRHFVSLQFVAKMCTAYSRQYGHQQAVAPIDCHGQLKLACMKLCLTASSFLTLQVLNERLRMGEPGAASHYQW